MLEAQTNMRSRPDYSSNPTISSIPSPTLRNPRYEEELQSCGRMRTVHIPITDQRERLSRHMMRKVEKSAQCRQLVFGGLKRTCTEHLALIAVMSNHSQSHSWRSITKLWRKHNRQESFDWRPLDRRQHHWNAAYLKYRSQIHQHMTPCRMFGAALTISCRSDARMANPRSITATAKSCSPRIAPKCFDD